MTALAETIQTILPEIVAARHHLHQNPELSGAEQETAAFVAAKLRGWGLEDIRTGIAGHGLTALLPAPQARRDAPLLALRADMDALPILETSALPYASCRPGIMHACGHDGHTAALLGAAQALSLRRDLLPGPVKFLFQPAEETVGGADEMIARGALEGVSAIFALHGWPSLKVGQIGYRPGPMMASADHFDLTLKGRGGHAAYPQNTIDPLLVGTQIVSAWQTLVSRETSPLESVVVSVTQFHAGNAYNVIPETAMLAGTVRCLSYELRDAMPEKLERVVAGVCAALRAEYEFSYGLGPPPVVNDPSMTALVEEVGREALGPENTVFLEQPSMGGEDFACYLRHVPGAMFRLGVGPGVTPLHTPTYNFSDDALSVGVTMFCHLALRFC